MIKRLVALVPVRGEEASPTRSARPPDRLPGQLRRCRPKSTRSTAPLCSELLPLLELKEDVVTEPRLRAVLTGG